MDCEERVQAEVEGKDTSSLVIFCFHNRRIISLTVVGMLVTHTVNILGK